MREEVCMRERKRERERERERSSQQTSYMIKIIICDSIIVRVEKR